MIEAVVITVGIVGGVLLTLVYLALTRLLPEVNSLNKALVFFIASAGAAAGIKVCIYSVSFNVLKELDNERLYVFFGGFAVLWISIGSIWRRFEEVLRMRRRQRDVPRA